MTNTVSLRRLASAAVLVAVLAGAGAGYSSLHITASAKRATTPATSATGTVKPPAAVVTGSWVYKDALTLETLRLTTGKKGAIGGSGSSTVKSSTDPSKSGQFTISVHDGHLRNNRLTMSLYVQQQFGAYFTLIEYLTCAPTARVLHCNTHAQIQRKVFDSKQDFYRR